MTSGSKSKWERTRPVVVGVVLTAGLAVLAVLLTMQFLANSPFADSPTDFTQATPVRMAASGSSIIFKSPGESNNCPLRGGEVRFIATPSEAGVAIPLRFSYKLSSEVLRNDVVRLSTPTAALALTGLGEYRLTAPDADGPWRSLKTLASTGTNLHGNDRSELSVALASRGHYLVRALDAKKVELFRGIMIPGDGKVYIRGAVLSPPVVSFSGHSQHDCGNWNSAAEADKALQRVEARIPSS